MISYVKKTIERVRDKKARTFLRAASEILVDSATVSLALYIIELEEKVYGPRSEEGLCN